MEEADAEAVLFALGPALEWRGFSLGSTAEVPAVRPYEFYKVEIFGRAFKAYRSNWNATKIAACSFVFETETGAKQACERHHALGRWR